MSLIKTIVNYLLGRHTWTDLPKDVTTIMDLPEDLTLDILMRLPAKSVGTIQCVSKASLNIAGSPGFATLHTLRLLDSATNSGIVESPVPHLMLLAKSRDEDQETLLFQSFNYNGGTHTLTKTKQSSLVSKVSFRKWRYYKVDFVFCNLFCFKRIIGGPCFLVNPLRGEVLMLPISNIQVRSYGKDWYGMGLDNITSTYKIVHVFADDIEKSNYLVAQVLVLGTSSWRQIHLVPPCDASGIFFGRRPKNAIYACGDVHRLVYGITGRDIDSHIISFDFNKEEFYVTPCPKLDDIYGGHPYGSYLLNFRGSLALVGFSYGYMYGYNPNIEIWVLKSYDEKKWELHQKIDHINNILDHDHFIEYRSSTETCVEWEHGICFASPNVCYFLDLRHPSMTRVELPTLAPSIFSHNFWRGDGYKNSSIFNYTESLISLKNYGNLIN